MATTLVMAQEPAAPDARPRFEVVSVKRCGGGGSQAAKSSPGRLHLECQQLSVIIKQAYDVFATGKIDPLNPMAPVIPFAGQPAWVDSANFTIDARVDAPASMAMMRGPMMQVLLEERFQLKAHRETRTVPVFALMVGAGSKLKAMAEGSCSPLTNEDILAARARTADEKPFCAIPTGSAAVWKAPGMSLDVFCKYITGLDRPVINRTGLTGLFDISLDMTPDPPPEPGTTPAPPRPGIVKAIYQLGLKLEPMMGPREFLVIDRIERPGEN
jgi:uncharacterized protein (TIGR03435 family)